MIRFCSNCKKHKPFHKFKASTHTRIYKTCNVCLSSVIESQRRKKLKEEQKGDIVLFIKKFT